MKVSKVQAEQNRERVLDVAAKLFRERGFDGIGVAELMKNAGLTHGGFYGQFDSKEELMAEASDRAFQETIGNWHKIAAFAEQREAGSALKVITRAYLSKKHCAEPGAGCVMATLGIDASRQSSTIRHKLTQGFRSLVDLFAGLVSHESEAVKREKSLAIVASLVGAMVIARAVDDETLSEEVLQAVSKSILS